MFFYNISIIIVPWLTVTYLSLFLLNVMNLFYTSLCLFIRKYITKKSPEVRPVFTQIISYCNVAFDIYFKIRRPLESFEVLIKMIILDMRFIDEIPSM